MSNWDKTISILERNGFDFVVDDSQANIIIKTPQEFFQRENGKLSARYKVIRASHICEEQIRLTVFSLIDLFKEVEDKQFLKKHHFEKFEGKLGENDFRVRI